MQDSNTQEPLPELPHPYKAVRVLGRGSYGTVYLATESLSGAPNGEAPREYAVKRIVLDQLNKTDSKRVWREMRVTKFLRHKNVVQFKDVRIQKETQKRDGGGVGTSLVVYAVFELMQTDLHRIIMSQQKLSEDHVKWFLYQLLRALKYIHSARILHRDLKPSNLLVNANCRLKVADFGLCTQTKEENHGPMPTMDDPKQNEQNDPDSGPEMTKYIVTRWYRAPELLINANHYSYSVDVWSVGCIFAELLNRKPLLRGRNYIEQLKFTIELVGTPSEDDMTFGSPDAKAFIRRLPAQNRANFNQLFPYASAEALDLLSAMLQFNPSKRCTVEQALAHPFLASMRRTESEKVYKSPFSFLEQYEKKIQSKEDVQSLIEREMLTLHPEICRAEMERRQATGENLQYYQSCLQEYQYYVDLQNDEPVGD